MKKIMFNDKYGLTQAVSDGRKTKTRRDAEKVFLDYEAGRRLGDFPTLTLEEYALHRCPYKVGDIVGVAQRYKDIYPNADFQMVGDVFMTESPGWNNKMFVRADLMANFIEITDVRFERLQDISDVDCQKEGVVATHGGYGVEFGLNYQVFGSTPREAFAALIDRISGRGTWERNPWVFAYEFKLIK